MFNMENWFICLFLLTTKHLVVDWYLQTDTMIKYKGVLFDLRGVWHSVQQAIGTFLSIIWFADFNVAMFLSIGDFLLHYFIDYTKMRFGCQDISKKQFWHHIGLDQYLHQITYLVIVAYLFGGIHA